MFRYLALAWQHDDTPAGHAAAEMSGVLRHRPPWQPALCRRGLEVFTRGSAPGVNQALALQNHGGVVLGKLFRRAPLGEAVPDQLTLHRSSEAADLKSSAARLVSDYWGRYVAILDDGRAAVLRDPSGALPCFVMRHQGVSIVFSWLEDALSLLPPTAVPEVDVHALAAHLAFGELGGASTPLTGITQVLPGQLLFLDERRPPCLLWDAARHARKANPMAVEEASTALAQTVRACTQAWAACHQSLLLRLSGGLDSSILAACLGSRVANDRVAARVTCVNYHSPGADSDERRYARLAARAAGLELLERERHSRFDIRGILGVARTPAPSHYVGRLGAGRMDAELAASCNAKAMFTGGGGDQVFYEFPQWWPLADYLRDHGCGAGLPAAAMQAARLGRVSVWRALRLAMTDRLRKRRVLDAAHKRLSLITEAVRGQAEHADRYVHPALLAALDLPIGKLTQTQHLMYPVAYYDPFEREAAPELVNPLLSQPLVELCLGLPSYLLTAGGRPRGLARRAFAAELPAEITRRRSKGGMEEHITALFWHNLGFAKEMLLDGKLVRWGLLDRRLVERALSSGSTRHTSRIGELHVYLGVEAWARLWSNPSAPP